MGTGSITAVVATYNEERYIGRCLDDLLSQQYAGDIEIIVVDGMSSDRTVDIVRGFPEYGTKIRLIRNPHRLQVFAWNAALRVARGEYYAMILAHARYSATYFAACIEVMRATGAVAVGGVQRANGEGHVGRAIAWCMSSKVGIGNARYRYTEREQESDSVFSIFTTTAALRDAGGYDERIPFDEDSDLNYRLRERGGRLIVSPRIIVDYVVRDSLAGLATQMFRYGYWRRVTHLKHPARVPWRVYAPATLLAALALSLVLAMTPLYTLAAVVPAAYATALVMAGMAAARHAGAAAVYVPAALATMHLSHGLGFWAALATIHDMPPGTPSQGAMR